VLFVARLLILLASLQVSGLGALLVGDCCSTVDGCCTDDGDDKPCNDCPPDCPKCHCNHSSFSVARSFETSRLAAPSHVIVLAPYQETEPAEPPRSSLFRPPRTAVSA